MDPIIYAPENGVILVTNQEILSSYEEAWNQLIPLIAGVGPTQTYAWFSSFLKHKKPADQKWICAFSFHEKKLTGVLPLLVLKTIKLPFFSIQLFSPPFDFFHTLRVDALFRPGFEHHYDLIIKKIARELRTFPLVNVRYIPDFSASSQAALRQGAAISVFSRKVSSEDYIQLPPVAETFYAELDGKFRREINRRLRRLKEENEVTYLLNPPYFSHAKSFEEFLEIENSGWKGDENSSILKRHGDKELFGEATSKFQQAGWMEWNFLQANELIIAGHLIVNLNGVIYLWKIGYKEDFSTFSPGNQLLYKYIEKVTEEKSGLEINFMNQRSWFKDWNIASRPLYSVIVFPKIPVVSWALMKLLGLIHKKKN